MTKLVRSTAAITTVCNNICELFEESDNAVTETINGANYHYTTDYRNAHSVCEYGILSLSELNKRGIRHDSKETLEKLSDIESHPNGIDAISLSREDPEGRSGLRIYDPFYPTAVDFRVADTVEAYRSSHMYDNEFLCRRPITPDEIKAIDIRIRKLCDLLLYTRRLDASNITRKTIVDNYNSLIDLANVLVRKELGIPLREMSDDDGIYIIDTQKLAEKPKISIK